MMCHHLRHWQQGLGVIDGVGARGGVAVGQGRERGCGARTYTSMSSPPCPLSWPWPTVVVVSERGEMAPTGQPPSLKQSNTTEPTTGSPLAITIHKLHDLLFKIAFPKSKNTKTAAITVDTLWLTQDLATSVCTALQEHHGAPQLRDISRQLDTIMSHLGIPSAAQLPQKRSYASVLTTGIQLPVPVSSQNLPCPVTHFDFTLTQKSQDNPVFAELSHTDIIQKIHDPLSDANCWFESTPGSPIPDGTVDFNCTSFNIRAVG